MKKKKIVSFFLIALITIGCNHSSKKENETMTELDNTVSSDYTDIVKTVKLTGLSVDDGDQSDFLTRRFDVSDSIRVLDHIFLCQNDEFIEIVMDSVRYILPEALHVGFISFNSDSSIVLFPVVDYQNPDDFHIEGYLYVFFTSSRRIERLFPLYNSAAALIDKQNNYYYVSRDTFYSVNVLTKESCVLCVFDEINMCSYEIRTDTLGYYEIVYIQDYYRDILDNTPYQKASFCLSNRKCNTPQNLDR